MENYYYNLLQDVISGTDSTLLIGLVVFAGLVLPLYLLIIKDRKQNRQHELEYQQRNFEREREVIGVMREVSQVIAECTTLTTILKDIVKTQGDKQHQAILRVHQRLDQMHLHSGGNARHEAYE